MRNRVLRRLVLALAVFLTACSTALQQVDAEPAKLLLPWLDAQVTKAAVVDRLGRSWKYMDSAERILIYNMGPLNGRADLITRLPDDASATHELVLVFDEQGQLKRHSLLRVKY